MFLRCIVLSHTVLHAILTKPISRNNTQDPAEMCLKCTVTYPRPMDLKPTALIFLLPGRTPSHFCSIPQLPVLPKHGILPVWASAGLSFLRTLCSDPARFLPAHRFRILRRCFVWLPSWYSLHLIVENIGCISLMLSALHEDKNIVICCCILSAKKNS